MVCSHEIAASTAQLVAASKVGAARDLPGYRKGREVRDTRTVEPAPRTEDLSRVHAVGSHIKILPLKDPKLPSSESLSSVSKEPLCPAHRVTSSWLSSLL